MTTQAGTGTGVWVGKLSGHRVAEDAGVLARGFRDNPNFVDLFPDEEARARALPRLQEACLRDALGFGHVYAASRGDELVGISAWLPPGAFPLSPRRQLLVSPEVVRVLAASPRSVPRLIRFMAGIGGLHPAQPYWYLLVVGVEPGERGSGIGARLLRPVLARADEAGEPCYLKTMTERNVAWYRGLGFEVRDAGASFTPGGPRNWTMLRAPRRRWR